MIKRIAILTIISMLTILMSCPFVANAEKKPDSGIYIHVSYSLDIKPSQNDLFILTYRYIDGKNTAQIKVNAYDLAENDGRMAMPEGTYYIEKIDYQGTNLDIVKSGFGIVNEFTVTKGDEYNSINLAIGYSEAFALSEDYEEVLLYQNLEPVPELTMPGVETSESSTQIEYDDTEDVSANSAPTPSSASAIPSGGKDSPSVVESDDSDEEQDADKEDKSDDSNSDLINLAFKTVPVLLFGVIFIAGAFIAHKKGVI